MTSKIGSLIGSAIVALALGAGASTVAAPGERAPDRVSDQAPKLVVLLAVDQMRADYVESYGAHWTGGLRRMFDQGAWFREARYPYLNTVTCPGHATLGTGAYPRRHGMILNTWYDRGRKKVIECTDDPDARAVVYGSSRASGHSVRNLMVPTLGDELQAQRKGRVAAFSMKARSSLSLAGHRPDLALWFENGVWLTSSAITNTPTTWVRSFLAANPVAPLIDRPWTPLLKLAAYKFDDDAVGEKPSAGWARTFPHPLKSGAGAGRFASSPAFDEYLGRLGREALARMKLGRGEGIDLLAIGFSMTDIVGHSFGPRSHEVQDVLARLDLTIGALLAALDAEVGRGRYVVALSADHGVGPIPEQETAQGRPAGRIQSADLKKRTDEAIAIELGGDGVASVQHNDIYLMPGVHERLTAKAGAIGRVLAALRAVPGVADAMDRSELDDAARARDPVRRAAALSYYAGRSGDFLVSPKSGWTMGSIAANHGSNNDYDQRVPVVFYGAGIKPGKYDGPASPADVVPTLGRVAGVATPKAEGTPLADALSAGSL